MNADPSEEKAAALRRLGRTGISLNSFRPVCQRDLDVLDSATEPPSSIPKLRSGVILPIDANNDCTNRTHNAKPEDGSRNQAMEETA